MLYIISCFSFQSFKDAKVEHRDGMRMVNELVEEMENMMTLKVNAVKVCLNFVM